MRFFSLLAALSTLLWAGQATNDGLTDVVEWDQYSLTVNGSRVFIYAGEFHYQRLPVPEIWPDIFQKFKANGFNAISIYFFWSYHSAAKGVYDFETSGKNVQRVLDYAKEAGLWVIARPGPYANAESTGGGLPLWGSDGSIGYLRTSDATYAAAWAPWVAKIGKIIADNEVTKGGPIIISQIENELEELSHVATNTLVLYMEQLETAFRAAGVTVPFSHNEKGMRGESWSVDYENVGGAVNLYGLDSYPGGTSCTKANAGYNLLRTYFQWFASYAFSQPSFFPEFEGGQFSPWGGTFYDDCASDHDPAFADLYYKNNIAQRITLQSFYMAWGGTNWGHSAAPVVYTSYDYSAPLRETRQIQTKFYQIKLIGLFTRASTDLLKTYMVGNGTGYASDNTGIFTWEIRNPDTNAAFYTTQQVTSSSRTPITFSANLKTSEGTITIPNINLNGRQSKILVTDYTFGNHTLLYSSAEVLTYGVFDEIDVIALHVESGQVGQFALKNLLSSTAFKVYGSSNVTIITQSNSALTFVYTQSDNQTVIQLDNLLIYLFEQQRAWKFWAPPTTSNPNVKPNEQIFVLGSYLVRNASISGEIVDVYGDNDNETSIEVYAGDSNVKTIYWNGKKLETATTLYGSLTADIDGTEGRDVVLPALEEWQSSDSLPEKDPAYDDSKWIVCNHSTTSSPIPPLTLPVLFASDYGFYPGAKIYRGYFDGKTFSAVNITASGGLAFGWNAWLNGVLIGGDTGVSLLTSTTAVLSFLNVTLKATDNVITVVVDYHGHDETSTAKGVENPRGILGASLTSSNGASSAKFFKQWKIQGNAGGSANIDPVRGPFNEGGLYGERLGWPLPGFSPSAPEFDHSTPFIGLNASGIQFYQTEFTLNIDTDLDVPLGIQVTAPEGTVARVMIWVNGYQYGKYVSHIGPQTRFPIPPGVINNSGSRNSLALSLWAMTDEGANLDTVELISYGVYESAFGFDGDWSYLQSEWDESRLQYA